MTCLLPVLPCCIATLRNPHPPSPLHAAPHGTEQPNLSSSQSETLCRSSSQRHPSFTSNPKTLGKKKITTTDGHKTDPQRPLGSIPSFLFPRIDHLRQQIHQLRELNNQCRTLGGRTTKNRAERKGKKEQQTKPSKSTSNPELLQRPLSDNHDDAPTSARNLQNSQAFFCSPSVFFPNSKAQPEPNASFCAALQCRGSPQGTQLTNPVFNNYWRTRKGTALELARDNSNNTAN